ncbi:hypothetical protein FOA43_003789 [Brettanomyces nanus]|uniref:SBE2/SBE22 middle domain-containing protein n=1 Tax=Eeniella nana TaxID=13502 RepID=A0A875RQB1_EENNA|nr:uncharacterized protein FOA43_003789 [Brettanomyces nanus]QPG76400.1 hypothetical protein FOA43_003789 [Brettanomyces nanus]
MFPIRNNGNSRSSVHPDNTHHSGLGSITAREAINDSNSKHSSVRDSDFLEIPLTDSSSVSSSVTLGPSRFNSSPFSSPSQKLHKKSINTTLDSCSNASEVPSPQQQQEQRLSGQVSRIMSRPSDLVLSALNQKLLNSRMFSGSSVNEKDAEIGGENDNRRRDSGSVRHLSAESSDSFAEPVIDTSISSFTSLSSVQRGGQRRASSSSDSTTSSITDMVHHGKSQFFPVRPSYLNSQSSFMSSDSHLCDRVPNAQSMPTLTPSSQATIVDENETPRVAPARDIHQRCQRRSLTKAEKDKMYDNDNGEVALTSDAYNVPIASSSTATLFKNSTSDKSRTILLDAWSNAEEVQVFEPSPLPGRVAEIYNLSTPDLSLLKRSSLPSSHRSSVPSHRASVRSETNAMESPSMSSMFTFSNLSPMAQQLSTFYEYSIRSHADNEMAHRAKMADLKLGNDRLDLKNQKLDDSKLISPEKLSMLSLTRPFWLPPKDKYESEKQEYEFRSMIRHEGYRMKKQSKIKERHQREWMIGEARLEYLSGKDSLSSSNVSEVKRLMWQSEVKPSFRVALFAKVIKHQYVISSEEDLNRLPILDASSISVDVNSIVDSMPHSCDDPKLITVLTNLLKKTTRMKGWTFNTYKVSLSLLNEGFSSPEALRTLHYLNDFIVDEKFINKFNQNLNKNKVILFYGKHFRDDLNAINIDGFVKLLNCFSTKIVFKLVTLLIAYGDYKILYAVVLTILLHYHFGWNNVQLLLNCSRKGNLIKVEDEDLFWARAYGLYKKF